MMGIISNNILSQGISWYLVDGPRNIRKAWKNFLWFNLHFFSISLLLKTLFAPWRRYTWSYKGGFDLGKYFEVVVSNLFSRFVGAIVRSFLVFAGILGEIFVFFGGIIILIGWFLFPFLIFFSFCFGLKNLIF